jgi:alpha-beta hydrolase superfamily lysophospholipase
LTATDGHARIELRVDVGSAAGLPGAETAVTVHIPQTVAPRAVLFAFPGRGYSRRYYDIDLPGPDGVAGGYSQAAHHTARGLVVVACDHLGVGESTIPDLLALTLEQLAAVNHATVQSVLGRFHDGSLPLPLEPPGPLPVVGAGQSMGGCLLTVQQGRHRTFDAVAILGWSGFQTVLPVPPGGPPLPLPGVGRDADPRTYPPRTYTAADLRYAYHWEDVPDAIAALDAEWAARAGTGDAPSWRSVTGPEVSRTMLAAGVVAEEAAAIDVPVFLGMGERDVCPDPHAEPAAYRASGDVTLFVQPRSGHMHNFASSRRLLWDRLAAWIESSGAVTPRGDPLPDPPRKAEGRFPGSGLATPPGGGARRSPGPTPGP